MKYAWHSKPWLWILAASVILVSCTAKSKDVHSAYVKLPYAVKRNASPVKPVDSIALELGILKKQTYILISKSDYTLSVVSDTVVLKTYPVVFGFNPVDDKFMQGDGCTPEGKFKIRAMYPHRSWSKFIWFDYPNAESWKKHRLAKAKSLIPKNAAIGGEVGIHGVPDDSDFAIDEKQNWTLGCISLKTNDINEIYRYVFVGMIVEIKP